MGRIRSLQRPGREIDALVHEQIMERPVIWEPGGPWGEVPFDRLAQETLQHVNAEREKAGLSLLHDLEFPDGDVPRYSSDLSATWKVVERMRPRQLLVQVEADNRTRVTFDAPSGLDGPLAAEGSGEGFTALAMAICLAALKISEK